MRIIGPPSATYEKVVGNVRFRSGVHARFLGEMFNPLWYAATRYGIDPVGVIAQAGKESGWGNFGGNVRPEFYNPCGLKVRHQALFTVTTGDQPLAHQMFANWENGADAMVQHLRAYTGWPVATGTIITDPRYVYVLGKHVCENFADLSGKWAPSPTYGTELEAIARSLQV